MLTKQRYLPALMQASVRPASWRLSPLWHLSESQLAVKDEKDQTIETIKLWREHNLLPKPKADDVTPVVKPGSAAAWAV